MNAQNRWNHLLCRVFGHVPDEAYPEHIDMDMGGHLVYTDYCGRCGECVGVR